MKEVVVPPSKSLSNRALILGLYAPLLIRNVLKSDDTKVLLEVLPKLGVSVCIENESDVAMDVRLLPEDSIEFDGVKELYVDNAGTATRFLVSALAFRAGEYYLYGNDRMHERPIGELVSALRQMGANISYLDKEGCLPLKICGVPLVEERRVCKIGQRISSQYLSGLLLAAPFWGGLTIIEREGDVVSQSYIDLTIGMLDQFGVSVKFDDKKNVFEINGSQQIGVDEFVVEPDWSSASYWFARTVVTGEEILLKDFSLVTLQGDAMFGEVLYRLAGLRVEPCGNDLRMWLDVDMSFPDIIDCRDFPDAAMTLAMVVAISSQTVELTGLSNLRVKECNRLVALSAELAKVGVRADELNDGLKIYGVSSSDLRPAEIETYNDHRMAMCFALLKLVQPAIEVLNPACVSKTYPTFWNDWN